MFPASLPPPAPMPSSPAPPCSRAAPGRPTGRTFPRSELRRRWRAAKQSSAVVRRDFIAILPARYLKTCTGREAFKNGLCELYIPEDRCSELENVPDVFSKYCGLYPFSPRHVGNFAEGDPLDLIGELLPFRLIVRPHPVDPKLLELRNIRPAEPGVRTCA